MTMNKYLHLLHKSDKKYFWFTKKLNDLGKPLNLFHGAGGIVQMMGPLEQLTRSEIVEWGFNPNNLVYIETLDEAKKIAKGE